jgi:HPt (histidine-containing phosphotransfer) domain-containing protein
MTAERLKPIYSSRRDDSPDGDAVDRFVIQLGERIDELQDAETDGDLTLLAALASELTDEADAAGYDAFVRCAKLLEDACLAGDTEDARDRLLDLTEIAQRIRLGHRGAS